MKCEDCGKEAETIVHYNGKDRCIKCDDKNEKKKNNHGKENNKVQRNRV